MLHTYTLRNSIMLECGCSDLLDQIGITCYNVVRTSSTIKRHALFVDRLTIARCTCSGMRPDQIIRYAWASILGFKSHEIA